MSGGLGGLFLVEADARAHTDSKSGTGIDRKCHAGIVSNSSSIFGSVRSVNTEVPIPKFNHFDIPNLSFEISTVRFIGDHDDVAPFG